MAQRLSSGKEEWASASVGANKKSPDTRFGGVGLIDLGDEITRW
jgi:hypothetical protein